MSKELTKQELKEAIGYEISLMIESGEIDEGFLDRLKARAAGAGKQIGSAASAAKQRASAGVTGLKSKAVGALGGDSSALDAKAQQQRQAAAATKASGAQAAKAAQAKSLLKKRVGQLSAITTALSGDVQKLGLGQQLSASIDELEGQVAFLQQELEKLGQAASVQQESTKRTYKIKTKE
jgi:hypothetical protein